MNATAIAADSPSQDERSTSVFAGAASIAEDSSVSSAARSAAELTAGGSLGWNRLLLLSTIAAYGFLRCSIPSVNEPHYLCKARAFWDASYCPGDFFLDSFPVHFAFYASVGWLTILLPLTVVAVVARLVAYAVLAAGFLAMLSPRLGARGSWAVVSATLTLACVGNFSGEWLVGGVESKCFAYGLVFWSVGLQLEGRWNLAAAALGTAVAFHPIVGLWSLCACLICVIAHWAMRGIWRANSSARSGSRHGVTPAEPLSSERPSSQRSDNVTGLRHGWRAIAILLVASLPGIIPAVMMMARSAGGELGAKADQIQFSQRLGHHLDPKRFSAFSYEMYAGMLVLWCLLMLANRWLRRRRNVQPPVYNAVSLNQMTAGSVLIAAVGLVIGLIWPTPAILKFYPFRLADALLPIATSAAIWEFMSTALSWAAHRERRPAQNWSHAVTRFEWSVAVALCGLAIVAAVRNPVELYGPPLSDRLTPKLQADLMTACDWISVNAAPDAVVLTPSFSQGFKWYASRAEYVCFKDCPQDAAGIIEWARRRRAWTDFFRVAGGDGFSGDEFGAFAAGERFDLVLAHEGVRIELPVLHRSGEFVVYSVADERR